MNLSITTALAMIPPIMGTIYLSSNGHPIATFLPLPFTLFVYLLPYIFLFSPKNQAHAATFLAQKRININLVPIAILIPNVIFAALNLHVPLPATFSFIGFIGVSFLLLKQANKTSASVNLWDGLLALFIWGVFELNLLKGLWHVSGIEGTDSLNAVMGVAYIAFSYTVLRPIKGIGFTYEVTKKDLILGLGLFAVFCAVALPIGIGTGFITYNGIVYPWRMLGASIGILFFIAIPEELLFRGMMQNFLEQKSKRPKASLLVTAIFFGVVHFNNGPTPDWRYALLATGVGLCCGIAHMHTKRLAAPVLIHTLVDATWVGYFM